MVVLSLRIKTRHRTKSPDLVKLKDKEQDKAEQKIFHFSVQAFETSIGLSR